VNTPNDIWKKRKAKEKNLVTDQPGNFVLFLGIFVSLILGFALRSFTQSKFLNEAVKEATKNIGSEWDVSYDEVRIYLGDGWLPAIGLEIDNLVLKSNSDCYLRPKAIIENTKIPVSFVELLLHQNPFVEVKVKKINVEFSHSKPVCNRKQNKAEIAKAILPQKNRISLVDKVDSEERKPNQQLKVIKIDNIGIRFLDNSVPDFALNDLFIENKSDKPKILVLKTKIDLAPFFRANSSEVKTELNAEYSEFPERVIKVSVLGGLREGHFSLSLLNRIDDKKYQLQTEVKNIPIQKLIEVPYFNIKKEFVVKSGWISFSGYSEGDDYNWESSRLEFKRIKLDGEFGDITSEEIVFPSGLKKQPEKFVIQLNELKLDTFFDLNKLFKIPEQINTFGVLNGKIEYTHFDKINYNGSVEGLAFNFSGNSTRQVEKIDRLLFDGELNKEGFEFKSTEISHQGKVDGYVNLSLKKDKKFVLKSELKKISLSAKTSKLLTQKNEPILIDLFQLKAQGDKDATTIESKVLIGNIANEFVSLENVEATVNTKVNKEMTIKLKINKLYAEEKLRQRFVKDNVPILENYQQINLNYSSDYDKSSWKVTTGNKWNSSGSWNKMGAISGILSIPKMEWVIQGTRDEPQLYQKSN
jgi:hypothetical protein